MRSNREDVNIPEEEKKVVEEPKVSKKPTKYIITVNNLALRSGPGREYEKLGIADAGQTLITDVENGFGKLADESGWVCMDYVRKAD